jgi:hypothetical protein
MCSLKCYTIYEIEHRLKTLPSTKMEAAEETLQGKLLRKQQPEKEENGKMMMKMMMKMVIMSMG